MLRVEHLMVMMGDHDDAEEGCRCIRGDCRVRLYLHDAVQPDRWVRIGSVESPAPTDWRTLNDRGVIQLKTGGSPLCRECRQRWRRGGHYGDKTRRWFLGRTGESQSRWMASNQGRDVRYGAFLFPRL